MNSSNDSLAMQRITKLVDENSFMEIGSPRNRKKYRL